MADFRAIPERWRHITMICPSIASLLLILNLLLFTTSPQAEASTLRLDAAQPFYSLGEHLDYLEDNSGQLNFSAVRKLPESDWKRHEEATPNFGFTESAYWFRITLEAETSLTRMLEVNQPLLDELSIYLFSGEHLLQQFQTGDTQPFSQRPVPHRTFTLPLMIPAGEPLILYLRVKTSGALQLPITLWSEDELHHHEEITENIIGIFFGIVISLLLYNLFLFLRVYETAYIYYVLYVVMFGLFFATLSGWSYKFLWPEAVHFQQYALALFVIMGGIFVCRFIHFFLDLPNSLPAVAWLLNTTTFTMLALLGLLPFFSYNAVIQAALAATVLIALIALFSGALLWRRGEIIARYFTIAWSAFMIAVILAILEKFALLPRTFWADIALPGGMALEAILLSMALGERINMEKQKRYLAQQQVIALQEQGRIELEQKVEERTIELEKANAKLQLLASTDGLTGIFNRRHFVEQATLNIRIARRYERPIALIMLDIDHFKQINDNFGHEAGNKVLIHLVDKCNTIKRETDIFGRLGGEEFAIMLLETDAEDAHAVAERIRATIEASPVDYEGNPINYTVSQGVSAVAGDQAHPSINAILKQADKALYEAKESGRNRVVMSPGIVEQ